MRHYLEKNPLQKKAGGVDQGEGPEFKSQYCKKLKNKYLELVLTFLSFLF
jgi:hypothetical protein